jgi:hypothetical protein
VIDLLEAGGKIKAVEGVPVEVAEVGLDAEKATENNNSKGKGVNMAASWMELLVGSFEWSSFIGYRHFPR